MAKCATVRMVVFTSEATGKLWLLPLSWVRAADRREKVLESLGCCRLATGRV